MTPFARRALASGSAAAFTSAAALLWFGRRETGHAATPLNGPSQWIWGRSAPYRDGASARHTLPGYVIHHGASLMWGAVFEMARVRVPRGTPATIAAAAATTAVANVVDFTLTPERFTPGFEKRLSRKALFGVYAAFALGLAAGSLLMDRKG